MSVIKLAQPATTALPFTPLGGVAIPVGDVVAQHQDYSVAIDGCPTADTGIWECSPGKFRRQVSRGEVTYILSGHCTFTPDGEAPVSMSPGDAIFFSPNTRGEWHITETLRKLYIML